MSVWSRILTVMINFSCQIDWLWEDDLSVSLWKYFLEELAKGFPPSEWDTPSGSILIQREWKIRRKQCCFCLPTFLFMGKCIYSIVSTKAADPHWHWDPASLAFQSDLKTRISPRIQKVFSIRLGLLENPVCHAEQLMQSQPVQCRHQLLDHLARLM